MLISSGKKMPNGKHSSENLTEKLEQTYKTLLGPGDKAEKHGGHQDLIQLLRELHESGGNAEAMIPPVMTDIPLGDVIPTSADAQVIGCTMKNCKRLQHVLFNTVNVEQLSTVAKVIKDFDLKVQFRDPSIQPSHRCNSNFLIMKALIECGSACDDIIKSSIKTIDLHRMRITSPSDFSVLLNILSKCDSLDKLVIYGQDINKVGNIIDVIRRYDIMIRNFQYKCKHRDEGMVYLKSWMDLMLLMVPHVTDVMRLSCYTAWSYRSIQEIQRRFNSLTEETVLTIDMTSRDGKSGTRLKWLQPPTEI